VNPLWPLYRFVPRSLRALWEPARPFPEQALRLARLLQIPPSELVAVRLGPRYHYRPFAILKSDGRERRILAPSPALKTLQRRLLGNYLAKLPVHPAALGFRPGASIVTNAQRHAGQTWIATLDLADFFESTTADCVRAFFVKEGWRGEALAVLMRLCVYRGGLPQGAPTSPCLSNLVNFELDRQLSELAQRTGGRYTRYGDDLTFSWGADRIPSASLRGAPLWGRAGPDGFAGMVYDRLHEASYKVQPRKGWRVTHSRASLQTQITGVVLRPDGRLDIPTEIRRRVWALRWRWWWTRDPQIAAHLQGYKGFLKMVTGRE